MFRYRLMMFLLLITPVSTCLAAPGCQPENMKLSFDSRDGQFDGMSQRGVMLVLRNTGSSSCELTARPELLFKGSFEDGTPATAEPERTRGVYAEPGFRTVTLEPQQAMFSLIRWVSGDVFDNASNCITTDEAQLIFGGRTLSQAAEFRLCAREGAHDYFTVSMGAAG